MCHHSGIHGYSFQMVICLMLLTVRISGDEIQLNTGEDAKTEILDTIGCGVKMMRRGKTVSIKKNLIKRIIWKSDTISYDGYVCSEKPARIVRFEDTPEYRLMAILDGSSELSQAFREDSRIAFLQAPLEGNYNSEEFIGIIAPLVELFRSKATGVIINPSQMIAELTSEVHSYDYAFLARKYHVEVNHVQRSDLAKFGAFGSDSQKEKKKELFTFGDFILYDILKKEIVFHHSLREKRSVWGEREYSWTGILTPEDWEREWQKKQTEAKLDRNALAIRKKMEKEIIRYIGITD